MIDFKNLAKGHDEEAIKDLQTIIQCDSVYDENTVSKEMPYGAGVFACFKEMEKIALREGFKVDLCDNHCVEISYGEGKKVIDIYAHLDVVPVNGTWMYPCFGGEVHDGKLYGRGASDDKGPAMAAFYALKLLKENNLIDDYKVRLVLGGDEERGSSCLEYYFHTLKKPYATYGFTPDAEFPLIYGEKGIRNYTYEGDVDLGPVIKIEAGVVSNAVIDEATIILKQDYEFQNYLLTLVNVKYEIVENDVDFLKVKFYGKAAHGSTPELGVNAGIIALNVVGDFYGIELLEELSFDYKDPNGRNFKQFYETKNMGITTYNVGIINYSNGHLKFVVNFRFPENVISDDVFAQIAKRYDGLELIPSGESQVLYFDPETPFIKALADVYVRETGDVEHKPMTIGGGTYAKEAKNTVAFGSNFPGKNDSIHAPNEKIDLEDFLGSIPIYMDAIYTLGKLD